MKRTFYSFITGMLLFGSILQANPSIKDLPKPSEQTKAIWTENALFAATTVTAVVVGGVLIYGLSKATYGLYGIYEILANLNK